MALFIDRGIATWNAWKSNVGHSTPEEILSYVKQYDLQKVIFYAQYEWAYWPEWPNAETFYEITHELYKQNKQLTVVAGSDTFFVKTPSWNIDLHYYPENTMVRQYYNIFNKDRLSKHNVTKEQRIISNIENIDYKYHFISLNRRAHYHRMEMIDLLQKYNLIETNAISWINEMPFNYVYKYWTPKIMKLTDKFILDLDQSVFPTEYYNSFAQLVVESSTQALIVTDKTAAALIIGKPFIVASCPFFHEYLQSMGFELYTEIFDYSFDSVYNQTERFDMIAKNLVNLSKIPHKELRNLSGKIRDKVEHNKRVFENIVFDFSRFPEPIKYAIDLYENEGLEIDEWTIKHWKNLKQMSK